MPKKKKTPLRISANAKSFCYLLGALILPQMNSAVYWTSAEKCWVSISAGIMAVCHALDPERETIRLKLATTYSIAGKRLAIWTPPREGVTIHEERLSL